MPGFAAAETPRLYAGLMAHDQGPFSNRNEAGTDLNLELELPAIARNRTWPPYGVLRPRFGANLSLNDNTSALYGGVGYTLMSGGPAFLTILAGLAIHNGPLTRPRQSCGGNRSDCGLGAPLLLHLGMEIGYRLSRRWAATAIYHHMSHNQRLAEENENIDSLGLRLQFSF